MYINITYHVFIPIFSTTFFPGDFRILQKIYSKNAQALYVFF